MKPTRETQSRWLLVVLGWVALLVATSGCSYLIAKSGVSDMGEIYKLETRAEVRAAFGKAEETDTCPDGRPVERRSFRAYAEKVDQYGACFGHTLTPENKETLHRVQALGADVDARRFAPDDALAEFHWCLGNAPVSWSCLRP
jgi:hypothetical protein